MPTRFTGLVLLVVLGCVTAALAQRGPITTGLDPEMERMAQHNLEVANHYYSKKKAYAGAKDRLLEVVEVYPEFTRIDEVYFILGECYVKTNDPTRAREFFERLLKERPDSEFARKARQRLETLPPAQTPQD